MENIWKHKLNTIPIVSSKVMKIFQDLSIAYHPPELINWYLNCRSKR